MLTTSYCCYLKMLQKALSFYTTCQSLYRLHSHFYNCDVIADIAYSLKHFTWHISIPPHLSSLDHNWIIVQVLYYIVHLLCTLQSSLLLLHVNTQHCLALFAPLNIYSTASLYITIITISHNGTPVLLSAPHTVMVHRSNFFSLSNSCCLCGLGNI